MSNHLSTTKDRPRPKGHNVDYNPKESKIIGGIKSNE